MLKEIFTAQNFVIYIVIINIIGFLAMYIDKQKAKRGSWRIPENTLFIMLECIYLDIKLKNGHLKLDFQYYLY